MEELVYITISLFFEISDSYLYGGMGSVGYAESKIGCYNRTVNVNNKYVDDQILSMAQLADVPAEKVKLITKEKYEENTEED